MEYFIRENRTSFSIFSHWTKLKTIYIDNQLLFLNINIKYSYKLLHNILHFTGASINESGENLKSKNFSNNIVSGKEKVKISQKKLIIIAIPVI